MIENIKKLGLNQYEARAYQSLLRTGIGSAVSISKFAHIPRARVYDVLVSLESKGFVIRSASRPIEFSVVKPTRAFEIMANQKKAELESSLNEISNVAKSIEKSVVITQSSNEDSAWILEGRSNIYSKIGEELDNCNETVVISSSEQGLKRKKGFFEKKLNTLTKNGVKVIINTRADSRFMVFDKKRAMVFLSPDKEAQDQEKALFIQSPFVANYLHSTLSSKK